MTGTGTQLDPYVVDDWSEFMEINIEDNLGQYATFSSSNTTVKFTDLSEEGYKDFVIWLNLDGNGLKLINLFVDGDTPITFNGSITNTKILNMGYNGAAASVFQFNANADNLIISGLISSDEVSLLSFAQDCYLDNSAIKIKVKNEDFNFIAGSYGGIRYSLIDMSVISSDTAGIVDSLDTPTIQYCTFIGDITAPNINVIFINDNSFSYNVYDMTVSEELTVDSSNIITATIYNNEKIIAIISTNAITGCTPQQLVNLQFLREHGFALPY